ncbi:MAG: recombinase RecT [bacterium JZ-2024 1]
MELRDSLVKYRPYLEAVLPKEYSYERFMNVIVSAVRRNQMLMAASPQSLLQAAMFACQLGLEPGPLGHLHLVPFYSRRVKEQTGGRWVYEVQPIIGYHGLIELARRSGLVELIYARAVYERDDFAFEYGTEGGSGTGWIRHRPYLGEEPGSITAYYAVAVFRSGKHQFEVVPRREVERVKLSSKAYQRELEAAQREGRDPIGPWFEWEDRMGMKTAVKFLCRWLPRSVETRDLAKAIEVDSMVEAGHEPDLSTFTGLEFPELPGEVEPIRFDSKRKSERIVSAIRSTGGQKEEVIEAAETEEVHKTDRWVAREAEIYARALGQQLGQQLEVNGVDDLIRLKIRANRDLARKLNILPMPRDIGVMRTMVAKLLSTIRGISPEEYVSLMTGGRYSTTDVNVFDVPALEELFIDLRVREAIGGEEDDTSA